MILVPSNLDEWESKSKRSPPGIPYSGRINMSRVVSSTKGAKDLPKIVKYLEGSSNHDITKDSGSMEHLAETFTRSPKLLIPLSVPQIPEPIGPLPDPDSN
jgi:hypothetical protein